MKLENNNGTILKDGEQIGTVENGAFVPDGKVHHATVKAVEKFLAEPETEEPAKAKKAKASDEPEKNPDMGDLTPEVVDWREANWSAEQFNELYPPERLKAMGR